MPSNAATHDALPTADARCPAARPVWREAEWWLAAALVVGCYFPRLDALTIRGEESRRARVAVEML